MAEIVKIVIGDKDIYAMFNDHAPEINNFNCTYGSVERISKLLPVYGSTKVKFELETALIQDGLKKLKQICLKSGYNLQKGDTENIYKVPEGFGLYSCSNGSCHKVFRIANFQLNRMAILNYSHKVCPYCGKRVKVIPSF